MGMVKSRATRPKPTVGNILAAAAELFVARNYADVTVDQIAEAANVTKGAVYHHFSSKQDVYVAMLIDDLAHKSALFDQAVAASDSCAGRLRALTGAFLALPRTEQQLIRLVRRDANTFDPETRAALVDAYQAALPNHVEAIIRRGIADGELIPADPRLLAWQYIALFEVMLTPYADNRFGSDADKLNYIISLFLRGCQRQGERA